MSDVIVQQLNQLKIEQARKKIFTIFISLTLLAFFSYGFFLNRTISETVSRKYNLQILQELNLSYQQLESSYFKSLSKIDIDHARSLGFVEMPQSDYVTRRATANQVAVARR